ALEANLAHRRVERGEQLVLGENVGAGDVVEQSRLAGVGVSDDGDDWIRHAAASLPMQLARAHHDLELLADGHDAFVDHAAFVLDLCCVRASKEAVAAALQLQVSPSVDQAALLVGEVRKLDLQSAYLSARTSAEDFEDEPGAVEHLGVTGAFQVA